MIEHNGAVAAAVYVWSSLDIEEVTRLLALAPSKARRRGDPIPGRSGRAMGTARHAVWKRSREPVLDVAPDTFSAEVAAVIREFIPARVADLRAADSGARLELVVEIYDHPESAAVSRRLDCEALREVTGIVDELVIYTFAFIPDALDSNNADATSG